VRHCNTTVTIKRLKPLPPCSRALKHWHCVMSNTNFVLLVNTKRTDWPVRELGSHDEYIYYIRVMISAHPFILARNTLVC
jgi:hypothetical protein